MNELKPEDVMKALECCITQCQDCYKCPMQKEKHRIGSKDCYAIVKQKALALLREKDARIDELEMTLEVASMNLGDTREWLNDAECKIAEKDAEIERLSILLDDFPNCKISGCEAARKDCHIGCPYGKENNNDSGTTI